MQDESKIFGISVRAFISIIIVFTLCSMTIWEMKIVEPFYTICTFVIGFFFGQKGSTLTTGGTEK
jgi:uncharacterized membrane protein